MNAWEGLARVGPLNGGVHGAPVVLVTERGYAIVPARRVRGRAALIEGIAIFAGVLLPMVAFAQWLMPGSDLSSDLMPLKLTATGLLLAFGIALLRIGHLGLVQEAHVDPDRGEIRLVRRNRRGRGREVGRFAFDAVASVIMRRSKTAFTPAVLCLCHADGGGFVELAAAGEGALLPIRDRLIADMSPRFRGASVAPRIRPHQVGALA